MLNRLLFKIMPGSRTAVSRALVAVLADVAFVAAAWLGAFWIRFNLELNWPYQQDVIRALAVVVPIHLTVFLAFGLYRGVWRYASVNDLRQIGAAVVVGALFVTAAVYMLEWRTQIPRSSLLLYPLLLFFFMGAARIAYRMWREHRIFTFRQLDAEPVLILGAGTAGAGLARELSGSPHFRVAGFLDDDADKRNRTIHGIRVLGPVAGLREHAKRLSVAKVIIAMPSASHQLRRRILETCESAGVKPLLVPSLEDLATGRVSISHLRNVEVDDLLGRDAVNLDESGLHVMIEGKVILVTGAGGSIGSELCRQVARFRPARLVLFELSEYALYGIEQEFHEKYPAIPIQCVVGDVKNRHRVDETLARWRPAVVLHAAAYKHVPLMEGDNALEAVLNNSQGTRVVAESAARHAVERFVLISTDKAVNPTNVMGASKRLAEMVCQELQGRGGTRFVLVRFGNVLGSTGSVIPKFRQQIAQGGPVTVTHPEITRYFMSIPEAAQLVLQAGLMGQGGEIFVLDMGEPVRIVDLASDMIRLSGFSEKDIRIVFTGLREGEKLFEELLADGETTLPTLHPKLRIAKQRGLPRGLIGELDDFFNRAERPSAALAREALARWVPEYQPETGRLKTSSGARPSGHPEGGEFKASAGRGR